MKTNLSETRRIHIYVDETGNLVIFSFTTNPDYVAGNDDIFSGPPPVVPAKAPIELREPFSVEELAHAIQEGIDRWNKGEPYINKRKSIEEFYYKTNGFKKASFGKRLFSLGWDDIGGKNISISLPSKTGKFYWTMHSLRLSDDADWVDFANALIELINADVTQFPPYKTFRRKLNV